MVRESFRGLLKLQMWVRVRVFLRSGFHLAALTCRPDWRIAAEMFELLRGSPLPTIRFLVNFITKALPPWSLSLDGWSSLGKVLLVPNFFHLWMMDLQSSRFIFLYPSPDLYLNPASEVCRQLLWVQAPSTGVCLSKSSPINWIHHKWTPFKLQKHLSFELHCKGC